MSLALALPFPLAGDPIHRRYTAKVVLVSGMLLGLGIGLGQGIGRGLAGSRDGGLVRGRDIYL